MPAKNKHTNNIFNGQLLHLQADAAFGRFCEAQSLISGDYKEVLSLDAGFYMQATGPRAAYRYALPDNNVFVRHTGNKVYELTDHLGNVRATVSDACKAVNQNGSWKSTAIVHNFNYYYPFGMPMPGLHGPANSTYRFGFNGKENDNELKGFGNQQDYGMRIYDTRIARFLSVDPITKDYPELTPYQFAGNNSVAKIDYYGLRPIVYSYINNQGKTMYSFRESGYAEDLIFGIGGFVPLFSLGKTIPDAIVGDKEITNNEILKASLDFAGVATDVIGLYTDFGKNLGAFGKVAGIVNIGLNLVSLAESVQFKDNEINAVVSELFCGQLNSSTQMGVILKYSLAYSQIEKLVDAGKLNYTMKGHLAEKIRGTYTKQDINKITEGLMKIDAQLVFQGKEDKELYMKRYIGKSDLAAKLLESLYKKDESLYRNVENEK